jgi:hypothetical protein
MIIGSCAVAFHGYTRFTKDKVDVEELLLFNHKSNI